MSSLPSNSAEAQRERRVRYLKVIAVFKILKGLVLLGMGASLLLLNSRTSWLDWLTDWAGDELLLGHSKPVHFLLDKLQLALAGGHLRALAALALIYSAVLLTEGIGVYLQKHWAEMLMVIATAGLIPLEVRHLWHRPSITSAVVVAANTLIVVYLYIVLKREHALRKQAPVREEPVSVS